MSADPVKVAADSLRSQVSTLGKQLGDFYRRAEGTGTDTRPIPPESGLTGRYSSNYHAHSAGALGHASYQPQHATSYRRDMGAHASITTTSTSRPYSTGVSLHGTTAWQAFSQPSPSAPFYPPARQSPPTTRDSRFGPPSAHAPDPYMTTHQIPYTSRPMANLPTTHTYSDTARINTRVPPPPAPYPSAPSTTQWPNAAPSTHQTAPFRRGIMDESSMMGGGAGGVGLRHGDMAAGPPQGSGSLSGALHGGGMAGIAAREESRMREMLQEVRHERRRLEDRLMSGDSQGIQLQELRDELERQVGALSRQQDLLEAETGGMAAAREAAIAAEQEVVALREALAAERHMVAQLHSLKREMEGKLSDLGAAVDALTSQHTQAVAGLTTERDVLSAKHTKALGKLTKAEGDLTATRYELEALRKELHARELSLAEVRASAEVLQAASAQMQSQLSTSKRDLEGRCLELTRHLEDARHEVVQASSAAATAQQNLQDTANQLKESLTRADFLRSEREKLIKVLQTEQATVVELKKQLEAVTSQAAASEEARAHIEATSRQQLEILTREHESKIAIVTKQFEAQLSAAEKAASAAAKQYDSSAHTGEKLLELQAGLRKERDMLWQELEGVRAELTATQQERDQLTNKVSLLRAEVKATMDDVCFRERHDRESRLSAAAQQHEMEIAQLRAHYENMASATASHTEAHTNDLLNMVERLRSELHEAQRSSEKQRASAAILKDQVAEALVQRDKLERELLQERTYGEELGRLVAEMKNATRDLR